MAKSYTLCDWDCPLKGTCNRYCPTMDKTKTYHFGVNPYDYKKEKCDWYEEMSEDDLLDRVKSKLN
jgi:hypothetical protein